MPTHAFLSDRSMELLEDMSGQPKNRQPYHLATLALIGAVPIEDGATLLAQAHHAGDLEPPLSPGLAEDLAEAAGRILAGRDEPAADEIASLLGRAVEVGYQG